MKAVLYQLSQSPVIAILAPFPRVVKQRETDHEVFYSRESFHRNTIQGYNMRSADPMRDTGGGTGDKLDDAFATTPAADS